MQSKAASIPKFLAELPAAQRAVVAKMEEVVRTTLPSALGTMKYGMPTFEFAGRIVAFNAQKNYYAFYADPAIVKRFRADLKAYDVGKSCIRFRVLAPELVATLKKILAAYSEK